MTRSNLRDIRENLSLAQAIKRALPLAGAVLAGTGVAQAQQADEGKLDEVVVSALKRDESLQDVPLSIQALGEEKLTNLQVESFDDYVKYLPNVAFQSGGPGFARPYMRGVASGENANHSGPQPSVGIYLDEQPITTIQGALDIQIYDIARVEVLAGPQGTLYGASSQAGTIRIITNRPDPAQFQAGFDLTGNSMEGDLGYTGEGYVNIPLGDSAAIRIVGWSKDEPGYIDNVLSSRVFPTSGIAVDNSDRVEDNYNGWQKYGARVALGIDLNDTWTLTPTVMAQNTKTKGTFGFDPLEGDLKVAHAKIEDSEDKFVQAALTLEGKIGNWDLTYAGAYLDRDDTTRSDYADYSFFYDTCCEYGSSMVRQRRRAHRSHAVHRRRRQVQEDQPRAAPVVARGEPLAPDGRRVHAEPEPQHLPVVSRAGSDRRLRGAWQSRHDLAHRPAARGRRQRVVRRAHVRYHRQLVRHGRHPLLRIGEFAQGVLRLRRGLLLRHGRGSMLSWARSRSAARPARTSTRRRRKTATRCASTSRGVPPTM